MGEPPISVTVRRGQIVEARHRVHAVAVQDGRVVHIAGDSDLVTFMRSAAKPLQALPLARAGGDLQLSELAIASASHLARPDQLDAVRSLLSRAGADEDDLECGPFGDPPSRLNHNCSGKHAGMLLLAHTHGWEARGYRLPDHPVQQAAFAEVCDAAGLARDAIGTAVDGCGVVTFALPLRSIALAFARLPTVDGAARLLAAMQAHPELIRGPGAPDTELMRTLPGWTAKGGADGLLCAAGPGAVGIALKTEDGGSRAVGPALHTFLARLGHDLPQFASMPLWNSRGENVGEIAVE
ncbi:MAG: asparaginase [Thermoleophilia bacterium]|nr:asparaginase [Thermoleophilia bacterium]